MWTERLAKYPKWKIDRLPDYTGPMNNNVFKFLDEVHAEPENVREALGYNTNQIPESTTPEDKRLQIARDFREHIDKIMNWTGDRESRLDFEWRSFQHLDAKYPHLNIMAKVRGEKRFENRS